MIECIAKDYESVEEFTDAVIDNKRKLKGVQIGKNHKIMGAGGKCILLMSKNSKEFVEYGDVLNKKGHFGKLIYKAFFEEDSEEPEVDVEEVLLDLKERMTPEQLTDLTNRLLRTIPNRIDFSSLFAKSEDFSSEIADAREWYSEIINLDVIRAFGLLEAIGVKFDSSYESWKFKRNGNYLRMIQNNIVVQFVTCREVEMRIQLKHIKDVILSQSDYGDILFAKSEEGTNVIVVCESPREVGIW